MGAEGVGVVEGLTVAVMLLRLSRVKPALGLDDVFSVKLTKGASPFSGVGRFIGAGAFPGAFAGVLRKYLNKIYIGNTISAAIETATARTARFSSLMHAVTAARSRSDFMAEDVEWAS
jgi:hypothetical protein